MLGVKHLMYAYICVCLCAHACVPLCLQVKLYQEKRSDLEEQQLHLNVGLQKIRETVQQVEELQKSLSIKRIELEEKNNAANLKLKQMVSSYLHSLQTARACTFCGLALSMGQDKV